MKVYANRWEGEFFSSFLLHGLSLAILISTKDLVPSGRLRRITLHTNHRKEFLQRGANRELAFFHARIRFNYFYLATIPILHETLQKLVKFQDFSKFHPALTKEKSSILRSINLSKGARNFLELFYVKIYNALLSSFLFMPIECKNTRWTSATLYVGWWSKVVSKWT